MTKKRTGPVILDLDAEDDAAGTPRADSSRDTGPVMIELDDAAPGPTPADAPPVPDAMPDAPSGQAMQTLATLAARRPSRLARAFWWLLGTIVSFAISVAAWDFVWSLIARNSILGYAATALFGAFIFVVLAIAFREWAAFARLARIDELHKAATRARSTGDLAEARRVATKLGALYAGRDDLALGREALARRMPDQVDADTLMALAETSLMAPLDAAATREVEAAARQVAAVTALVPLALADVVTALASNLRMIRRIAEIYGGRSGTLEVWRLTRAVFTHLVATGAVAVGDDMLGSVAGGSILSKVSRRFGEGIVNGALTARVGVAAIEVCRPLPFVAAKRPSVSGIVSRSLTGLFRKDG